MKRFEEKVYRDIVTPIKAFLEVDIKNITVSGKWSGGMGSGVEEWEVEWRNGKGMVMGGGMGREGCSRGMGREYC